MSAISEGRFQQFLRELREARPRGASAPAPKAEMMRLGFLIGLFRLAVGFLLPVLCLALFLTPLIVRIVFDSNALKPFKNFFGLAALGIAVAWWRAFFHKPAPESETVIFDRTRDRRLYELADAIAEAVGSPPVDEISMSPFSSFAVHERGRGKARTLHLSLDSYDFEGLTLLEFSSILAHEFAHFSKGHTAHGLKLYRRTLFLQRLRFELEKGSWNKINPIYGALLLFEKATRKLITSIQRGHERQADAMARELLGGVAATGGLEKTTKNAIRSDALMHSTLGKAIREGDRKADWIEAIREYELDENERAVLEERWQARLNAETSPLASHPSIKERREDDAKAGPPLVQLADDATPAFEYLLGRRSDDVQRTLSREAVESNLEWRSTEPGLRGGSIEAERGTQLHPVTVKKFRTGVPIFWLISAVVGFLLFGMIFLVTLVTEDTPAEVPRILGILLFSTLVMMVFSWRARGMRMHGSSEGLDFHGLFGTTRIPWDDVTAARIEDSKLTVFAHSGGSKHKMKVRGDNEPRRDLEDMVLELSPALAYAAWGTGLSRVAEPKRGTALPDRVYELSDDLYIEGPDETRIVIDEKDPRHESIHEHLETRLLPAMLAAD